MTAPKFDGIEREYISRKGWSINADGLIEITRAQARKEPYIGHSVRNPKQRMLLIAGTHGTTLLFEGQHFIITKAGATA